MVSHTFTLSLQNIRNAIKQSHFQQALMLCLQLQATNNESINELKFYNFQKFKANQSYWELQSLRGYCLANIGRVGEAIQILEKCLKEIPSHSPSCRRLANLHQKEGMLEEALKYYKTAQLYEPDSLYLSQRIIKIQTKLKKHWSSVSDIEKGDTNHSNTNHSLQTSAIQISKHHVTFGSYQVFQMASEDSDQYFAHIKSQINQLGEVKPKKSILKCSKSLNKISDQKMQYSHHFDQEKKYEFEENSHKKALSIKSEHITTPKKWEETQEMQKQKSSLKSKSGPKKQKTKKKSVCFSFEGDIKKDDQ